VCIENLIRFDCVVESHNVSANGRADIPLAEHGCLALQVEEPRRMSDEDLKDELERLRKENAALKKGASSGIRMKASGIRKGAVSIYGMGRFPVTLYKEQWLKLLDMSADIRAFIDANEAQLKRKD
jgi:hypothetical protein